MNKNIIFRVNDDLIKQVNKKVNNNPEIYLNKSHFIRIALIKELKRKI